MNVLILEDDVGLAELLSERLEELGFSTESAGLGRDAISVIQQRQFSLVILDYNLPDMTGEQIWKKIKESVPYPPACIVATGEGDENIAVEMMKAGVRDYLVKDIEFLEKIPVVVQRVAREVDNEKQLLAAQKKLSNTYKLIESVIEQSPGAEMIVSPDGTLEKINCVCRELLGVGHREDIRPGKNVFQLSPVWELFDTNGNAVSVEESPLVRTLQGETIKECELRVVREDKTSRWVSVNSCPIYDAEHNFLAGYVSFSDITQRKQAEAEISAKTTALERIFNDSPYIMVLVNDQWEVVDINRAGIQFSRYQKNEIHGLLAGQVFRCVTEHEGLGCGANERCEKCPIKSSVYRTLNIGESVLEKEGQLEVRRDDGSLLLDVLVSTTLLNIDEKKQVLVIVTDISERKQAERAVQESEERFSKAFHHSPDTITITRMADGKIIDTNLSFEKMFRIPRAEAIGKTSVELGIWKDSESRERVVKTLRADAQIQDMELCGKYFRSSGEPIDVLLSADTINIAGEACIVAILRDITERNKKENEKKQLEAQLNQSQKMESVGRLAGGVAHDFNNMLGVILGYGEMILDEMDSSNPMHGNLQQIVDAAERSADLTRQLLAFARKQTVTPKVLDLNETIENMTQMLQRVIGEDIGLVWHPGEKVSSVRMDPGQMDQILVNLCVNARDAISDVGKVTIKTQNVSIDRAFCDVRPGFIPGSYVKVSVIDTGCGMPKETVRNIFEPFFTTKEAGKGTGLGLSTVYGIVKQNNGLIDVASEPGKGTAFDVYIPCHVEKLSETPHNIADRQTLRGDATILLVEDEPTILTLTTRMLKQMGYAVVAANTPGEAIRLSREHAGDIHLLVTDVVMPEMNGRNLAKNIMSFRPNIKCLFMSGYTADVIAHHGVVDEGVNFISKPFRFADLSAKVSEALMSE